MSDNESIIEKVEVTTEKFKEYVKEWIKIHDRLSEIRRDTSALNKRKKQISGYIMVYMKDNDKELCNLGDSGTLMMKNKVSALTLKKEDIVSILQEHMNKNEEEAIKTADILFENKRKKENTTLQRNINPI